MAVAQKPFGLTSQDRLELRKRVLGTLRAGRRNAITGQKIATLLGFKDDRHIRNVILELVKEGHPIATSVSPPAGFFIAETAKEVEDYRRDLRARLKKIALHSRNFRIAARSVRTPEQLSLV